jgi:hypothetical protein
MSAIRQRDWYDQKHLEERVELFKKLKPIAPWGGTAKLLHRKLHWAGSVQSLTAAIKAAQRLMHDRGLSVTAQARKGISGHWSIKSIPTSLDHHSEPKILFDSRAHKQPMEDTMATRELDLTNEGQSSSGLGIRLVWEVSEGALQAFFAVLPLLKSGDAADLTELVKKLMSSGNYNTVRGVSDKHQAPLFTKPENNNPKTSGRAGDFKPSQDPRCVRAKRKDNPKGKAMWILKSTLHKEPGKYIEVRANDQ